MSKIKWKIEIDYNFYKVYDGSSLAGYFFPHYGDVSEDEEDEIAEKMNKSHSSISESTLLLPMVKLDLLDSKDWIDLDYVISSLDSTLARTRMWKDWFQRNAKSFSITAASVHTAREDRNMLSIAIRIKAITRLDEKDVTEHLVPMLDKLHEEGLL